MGPSGLISAQAQKFTAKPTVASASISHGEPVRATSVAPVDASRAPADGATTRSFIRIPSRKGRTRGAPALTQPETVVVGEGRRSRWRGPLGRLQRVYV